MLAIINAEIVFPFCGAILSGSNGYLHCDSCQKDFELPKIDPTERAA